MHPFIKLVEDMRTAQKDYFSNRNAITLSKAKNLERAVDVEVNRYKNIDQLDL